MRYHYTECGLDNVWLLNGYTIEQHPNYGELFAIDHVDDLHRFIGRSLIALPRLLNGAEFRFLRRELDLSQKTLADLIGSNEQSVAKWEKARNKPVGSRPAERLMRLLYADSIDGAENVRQMLEEMSDLDAQLCDIRLDLKRDDDEWLRAAA